MARRGYLKDNRKAAVFDPMFDLAYGIALRGY